MLYSLIPPIIIVASLIGIILMLVKKSSQVAELPADHFSTEDQETEKRGFLGKIVGKTKNIRWDDGKHVSLTVLEKIVSKSRVLFLKLESRFANLSNDMRAKRQARQNQNPQKTEMRTENDILRKLKEYKSDKSVVVDGPEEAVVAKKKSFMETSQAAAAKAPVVNREKEVKPMISEKIVTPRARTEIKDRLEELLIERIAINPKDIEAYERLGEYYMEIKSYNDAKECFKQVIKLNPSDRNAKYRMKRLENILAKQ
ncbi:MAG: tetratricopeptide repeat protein [Parcubacteria group bacterium]|jgi:tetratricopeptide (TPR) repeat protein